jgi:hypothetical protein
MAITSQAWNVPDMLMLVLRSEEYLSIILPIETMFEPPVGIHVVRVKVGFFSTTGLITYSIRARRVSFLVMDA